MADKKISQLTGATTPLAGTEVLPVVQSSTTKKVAVSDMFGTNVYTFLNSPTSANLAAAVTDETGSGALVFGTAPTVTTPTIGWTGNFSDSFVVSTTSSFSTGSQCYYQFKDANGVTAAINAWGGAYGNVYSGAIGISANMVNTSAIGSTLQYSQTGLPATFYKQYDGAHYFYRAPSGTAGNSISFTETFVLDSSNNAKVSAGNVIIGTAGKGIDFSANTGAAGMTSELLNWYEEGTFSPTIVGTSTAGTATYTQQNGKYTRVGRLVFIELYLIWGSGTGTGNLRIDSLPFTVGAGSTYPALSVADPSGVALSAGYYITAYALPNSTQIYINQNLVGGGNGIVVPYDAAGSIQIAGCYTV